MDLFKEKTIKNYTSWDINCPYVCRMHKTKRKLRYLFKKVARRKLKQELRKELKQYRDTIKDKER